jgi:hypothetical protein
LPRAYAFQPHVPHIAGLVSGGVKQNSPSGCGILSPIEEVQAHAGCMAAEHSEVNAAAPDTGSEREGYP